MENQQETFLNRNVIRWDDITLTQEWRRLQREKEHLLTKRHERPLTRWEIDRIQAILDEGMEILGQLSNLRYKAFQS